MIDTVRLSSPALSEDVISVISAMLRNKTCIENNTGQVVYDFTSGSLFGSGDSRTLIQVRRDRWEVPSPNWRDPSVSSKQPIKVECDPYIVIEGSVHKAMLTHNVFGGPLEWFPSIQWWIASLGESLEVSFPFCGSWLVERVDWAEAFDMGCREAVEEFLNDLQHVRYYRRKAIPHNPGKSLAWPGTTSYLRAYAKEFEFQENGYKSLRKAVHRQHGTMGMSICEFISACSVGILRVELEIKAKGLDRDFGTRPRVDQISSEYLRDLWEKETGRVFREESEEDMKTVRTAKEVEARLVTLYGVRLGLTLFGTWLKFCSMDEGEVRKGLSRPTFYRQRSQLEAAGVSWVGSDVTLKGPKSSHIPEGFSVCLSDPRRLTQVDPKVFFLCESAKVA